MKIYFLHIGRFSNFFGLVLFFILIVFVSSIRADLKLSEQNTNNSKVENVRFSISNKDVIVKYDLLGVEDKKYKVELILKKESDAGYQYTPHMVSGDVGTGAFAGKNKQIAWSINEEFPNGLPGNDYYFVVQAEEISEGTDFLSWVGIGAAAAAAAATYFIISKKVTNTGSATGKDSFPPPPGRP